MLKQRLSTTFTTIKEDEDLPLSVEDEKHSSTNLINSKSEELLPKFLDYRLTSFAESGLESFTSEADPDDGFDPSDPEDFKITRKKMSIDSMAPPLLSKRLSRTGTGNSLLSPGRRSPTTPGRKTPRSARWGMILGNTTPRNQQVRTRFNSSTGKLTTIVSAIGSVQQLYAKAATKSEKREQVISEALQVLHSKAPGSRNAEDLHSLRNMFKVMDMFHEGCDWRDVQKICQDTRLITVVQNSPIFVQGQLGSHFYVLIDGVVTGYSTTSQRKIENLHREFLFNREGKKTLRPSNLPIKAYGNEVVSVEEHRGFGDLKPGDSLYAWSAVAETDCRLLQIRMDLYVACMRNNGQMNLYNLIEFLKKTRLLNQIPDRYLSNVAYRMKSVKFTRGEKIVKAGQEIKEVMVIHSGEATFTESESIGYLNSSYNLTCQTVKRDISTLLAGNAIGALELLEEKEKFENTLICSSPSTSVLKMSVKEFRRIERDHAEVLESFQAEELARVKWRQKRMKEEVDKLDQYILSMSSGEERRKKANSIHEFTKIPKHPRSMSPRNEIETNTRKLSSLMGSNLRNLSIVKRPSFDIVTELEEVTDSENITEQMKNSIRSMKSTGRFSLGIPKRDKGSPDFSSLRPPSASSGTNLHTQHHKHKTCRSRPDSPFPMSENKCPSPDKTQHPRSRPSTSPARRRERPPSPLSRTAPYAHISTSSPNLSPDASPLIGSVKPLRKVSSTDGLGPQLQGSRRTTYHRAGSAFQLLPSEDGFGPGGKSSRPSFALSSGRPTSAFGRTDDSVAYSPIMHMQRSPRKTMTFTDDAVEEVQPRLPNIPSPEDMSKLAVQKGVMQNSGILKLPFHQDGHGLQLPSHVESGLNSPGSPGHRSPSLLARQKSAPEKLPGYQQNSVKETLKAERVLYANLENFAMEWVAENKEKLKLGGGPWEEAKKVGGQQRQNDEPLVKRLQRLAHVVEPPGTFQQSIATSPEPCVKTVKLPSRAGVVYDIDNCC